MRAAFAPALAFLVVLAGCAQPGENPADASRVEDLPASAVVDEPLPPERGTAPTVAPPAASPPASDVAGLAELAPGKMVEWSGTCPCPTYRFRLAGDHDGWMAVRVAWDGAETADLGLAVLRDGRTLAEGGRGFDDRLARVHDPAAGAYVVAVSGTGAFTASARLGSLDIPAGGALLPNLVELVIEGPAIGPCNQVEQEEQGAVKCMRFGNGVGNPGHGPVQIRLSMEQGVQALLPLDGRFVQEVRQTDGSVVGHVVGPAVFHASHTHWHYDGFALFELFHYDAETGLRGERAASHHKSGFCFLDWDTMPENITEPAEQERAETDCLVPGMGIVFGADVPEGPPAWTNGISRGWYDFYEQQLTDQYVDVAGLPDGLYELVATADSGQTLDELDETDNRSSLVLRLAGDDVEVVEERAHYRVQEEDDH